MYSSDNIFEILVDFEKEERLMKEYEEAVAARDSGNPESSSLVMDVEKYREEKIQLMKELEETREAVRRLLEDSRIEAEQMKNQARDEGHEIGEREGYEKGYLDGYEKAQQEVENTLSGVPKRMWFDNASSMVCSILKNGERSLTEGFIRFKNHFGFEATFCNAARGQEKGAVENKVGYLRRNLLVPVPQFLDIHKFNQELLVKCDEDSLREHYRKEIYISELFNDDKEALIVLRKKCDKLFVTFFLRFLGNEKSELVAFSEGAISRQPLKI